MGTNYTEFIKDGTVTSGKDFLRLCLRHFGVALDMVEEPILTEVPNHFEINDTYEKDYKNSVEKLNNIKDKYSRMSMDDIRKEMKKEYESERENALGYYNKCKEEKKLLQKVKKEIEQWMPPTKEHGKVKAFALVQIEIELSTNMESEWYYKGILDRKLDISDEAVRTYVRHMVQSCEETKNLYYKNFLDEKKRVEGRNLFMQKFTESLEALS